MTDNIITTSAIIAAQYVGGIEVAGFLILLAVGALAALNRAGLPVLVASTFLMTGALYASFGGVFLLLYGLCAVVGGVLTFLAAKQQFSQA